ncbi:MAG: 3-phosphoshikimate 1-carboxyvinyltransferase [Clostridia bacterium]|nr:3-phosphoshikimate 1-carboxyvinyltransferase [Clostridia bacterium]
MNIHISKGRACGIVSAPPSKSMAHRLLICAGLSDGVSHIRGVDFNEDILATIDCLRALGATVSVDGSTVTVCGVSPRTTTPQNPLCCRESGSTLRFFLPLALLGTKETVFTGSDKLLSRPLSVYETLCREHALCFTQTDKAVTVKGALSHGEFAVAGNISSQFISGLLFALPLLDGDSVIRITSPVESRSYISLTLQALHAFGIRADWQDEKTLKIDGNQRYTPTDMTVEGDYSGAAFLAALNSLGGNVTVNGLSPESLQGDKVYAKHFAALASGTPVIHIADCPDLGPVLFAVAAAKNGGIFTGTRRLKIKESDRAAAMAEELAAFGTAVTVHDDAVTVFPADFHAPAVPLKGHNDHRIVMALSLLLTLTGGEIQGAQAVRKSFPDFFKKLQGLGIEVNEI